MNDTFPHPDRDAMYAAFEESPGDLAAYGAMADLLDDLGYASVGYAYRWMQRRGVWPHKRTHYVGDLPPWAVPRSARAARTVTLRRCTTSDTRRTAKARRCRRSTPSLSRCCN